MPHTEHMKPDSLSMDEALTLSAELAALTRGQYEALLKSSVRQMSPETTNQYDQRRLRIGEICEKLKTFESQQHSPVTAQNGAFLTAAAIASQMYPRLACAHCVWNGSRAGRL